MYRAAFMLIVAVLVGTFAATEAHAAQGLEGVRILFLTKSEGFMHSVVAAKAGKPSHAGSVLAQLAKDNGATLDETNDASVINAENLKNYDLLIFYTQGDIRNSGGKDGAPGMGQEGLDALIAWVKAGGALMGFHAAADTLRMDGSPYRDMIGAGFAGHGAQFEGTVKVVDAAHPAMKSIPQDWRIKDEWYMFNHWNKKNLRVLALMDPGPKERKRQPMYNAPDYPVIWVAAYGDGLVYYNALGHREDVWTNPTFQNSVVDATCWVLDKANLTPEQTQPNFDEVVPKDKPAE